MEARNSSCSCFRLFSPQYPSSSPKGLRPYENVIFWGLMAGLVGVVGG